MRTVRRFFRDNGLTLSFLALFMISGAAQSLTGLRAFNHDRVSYGATAVSYRAFLRSGSFLDGMFVNWQAAVLQLAMLVLFGTFLVQRGATHSRKPEEKEGRGEPDGGRAGWVYSHSLTLAFFLLFAVSFVLHVHYGAAAWNEERALRGSSPLPVTLYFRSARCWTAVFACWEAEFFAIVAYIFFSIFLREKKSPESKPVNAPDSATGVGNS